MKRRAFALVILLLGILPAAGDAPIDEKWLAARERELERCRQTVGRLSAEARSILDAVVVFDRVPRWMAPLPPKARDVREAGLLVSALDALAEGLGYERVRVA